MANIKSQKKRIITSRKALTRLRVYAGAEHNNAAQKPVAFEG